MFGGMPKIPVAKKGGDSDGELDAALAEMDELQTKLAESKSRIYDALQAPLPAVEIPLPRLDPGAFGPAPAPAPGPARAEYEPLAQNGAGAPNATLPAAAPAAGRQKAAARQAKAEAARAEAERSRQEMEEHARAAAAVGSDGPLRLALCLATSATSVVMSLGLGAMQLGPTAGPVISAVTSCVICMAGLAHTWKARSEAIFDLLNKVFAKLTDAVIKVLDTFDDVLQGPLDKLDGMIDGMIEEQKPTLAKMQQFEDTIRKLDPDFDIPDPQDLKRPLDGCEAMIDEILETARREVPGRLEEAVRSTAVGRLATSRAAFQGLVVCCPLLLVFLLNLAVGLGQVALAGAMEGPAAEEPTPPRRLRGAAGLPGQEAVASAARGQLLACVQPALLQAALSLLQTLAALLLTQLPRICGLANRQIEALEADLSAGVNERVEGAVGSVFGPAFGEVRGKADEFFPKFTGSVQKLRESMEQAAKLQAAAGAAAGVAKRFGF